MPELTVGVSLGGSFPQGVPDARLLLDAARHAETSGFDAIWSGDHVMMWTPIVDCVTLLAGMAAVTSRIRLGTAVYLLALRHPTITAKLFAGIDYLSGGRLDFGVGVGGEFVKEFEACSVPHAERGARTDEALDIVLRLWREERVTYQGRFWTFTDAAIAPRPIQQPHPPIWVGGRSEAALRRTARAATGWLAYMATRERILESMARIGEHASALGRDPASIECGLLLFTHVGPNREAARKRVVDDLSARYNQPFEKLVDRYCAFGTAEQCAETIARFVEAGVSHVAIKLTCAPEELLDQQAEFAERALPLIRRVGR